MGTMVILICGSPRREGFGRDFARNVVLLFGDFRQKMFDQQRHVEGAFAERRNVQMNDVDAPV